MGRLPNSWQSCWKPNVILVTKGCFHADTFHGKVGSIQLCRYLKASKAELSLNYVFLGKTWSYRRSLQDLSFAVNSICSLSQRPRWGLWRQCTAHKLFLFHAISLQIMQKVASSVDCSVLRKLPQSLCKQIIFQIENCYPVFLRPLLIH